MPFIRDNSASETENEARFIMPPRESPMETALHETLHVVIARLNGLDIAEVVENDDMVLTVLAEPQKLTADSLMAPEIFMTINNISFTEHSVSSDRKAIVECYRPECVEDTKRDVREWLELVFRCPNVRSAISILSAHMHNELQEHRVMDGLSIHEIIDPILKSSPYAEGLREKLGG